MELFLLLLVNLLDLIRAPEHHIRHLRRDRKFVSRISIDDHLTDRTFTCEVMIHPRRIAVGKATLEEKVDHLLDLGNIDRGLILLVL